MEVRAVTKFVRMSPQKARPLARAISGQSVAAAQDLLRADGRKAARHIRKTLRSAVANAENNDDLSARELVVSEAVIEAGPTLKRYWPRARGMVSPIRRRTSHIRIVLSETGAQLG